MDCYNCFCVPVTVLFSVFIDFVFFRVLCFVNGFGFCYFLVFVILVCFICCVFCFVFV